MILPLDQSILELLNASRDDEANLSLPVNDRTFGFHAQQAIEKLLKALIGGLGHKYKYTHDLADLSQQLTALGEQLPVAMSEIGDLTDYAGIWRYQEPGAFGSEQRVDLRRTVAGLREYVLGRLLVLRPGFDWGSLG